MKKIFKPIAVLLLSLAYGVSGQAQNLEESKKKSKGELQKVEQARKNEIKEVSKDYKHEVKEAVKTQKEIAKDQAKAIKNEAFDKSNNGNAYGKDKKELEKREFEIRMASEAQEKMDTRKVALAQREAEVKTGRTKIELAKEKLELLRKESKVDTAEIAKKEVIIVNAEAKVNALDETLKIANERLNTKSEEILRVLGL